MTLLSSTVLPETTVTAAIALQLTYWLISAIGLIFINGNSVVPKILIFYFIVGLFFLVLSEPFVQLMGPLIPLTSWSFSQNFSMFFFFLTNIIFLIIIIQYTGKMLNSIYTPALTVLPALAIFLHESVWRIVFYTIIISIFYFTAIFRPRHSSNNYAYESYESQRNGTVIISILSLIMSVVIGTITK